MNNRRGFTLVELLVVIAIMAILTVITASQFATAKQKARDVQRKADLSSVTKALQLYFVDYGKFPPALAGSINADGKNNVTWGGTFTDTANYVYMKVMPKENSQKLFPYCYASDGKRYGLFAQIENVNDVDIKHDPVTKAVLTSTCNGQTYNYYLNSPNTSLDSNGNFN